MWIEHNAFNEFITNFGIDLKAIHGILKLFPNNQISYLEILRKRIIEISSLSPSALKFILDFKVENIKERINALAILNESSVAVKQIFDLQIKNDMFFEKYGVKMDFDTIQKSLTDFPGWEMLSYCEYSIKVLENDFSKDLFRYPDFYLERTLPFTTFFGEHLFKAAESARDKEIKKR